MEIKAFRAYRFNPDIVGDNGNCAAPPYDVINDEQRERLYAQSPYNIVRIIKGKTEPGDDGDNNQYTRAAAFLNEWTQAGALKPDDTEAIYAYVQDFEIAGENYCRGGFIALGKLTEFGAGVQPHEKTLDGPKADRLKLTQATAAQFGQIFMLYDDPTKTADKIIDKIIAGPKAAVDFVDEDKVRHRLFAISDPQDIAAITEMMKSKEALIADGHHRYETALNYYRQTNNPAAQWRMMTFVNMQNAGLVVLPTHRLVGNIENFDMELLTEKLQEEFKITSFTYSSDDSKQKAKGLMFKRMQKAFQHRQSAFGIYDSSKFYFIVLTSRKKLDLLPVSNASKSLDVVILHQLILDDMLGIGEKQLAEQTNVTYIKDIGDAVDEAIRAVDSGQKQLVFFMNATRARQVKEVAAENEKMPQKSTFFYPKIFSGLTINKLS
ncbi:MAG: DUF1015 domain-containing protein [Sedimentisphaerales bacterium]|nr:DUF1015 domain-containing protein [Sedimentisphaerales bacterium]